MVGSQWIPIHPGHDQRGRIQGRRSTVGLTWPVELPPGDWVRTLRTTWVEPAYLEPDASWCEPGGEPAAKLMRKHRAALIASIVQWTGQRKYTVSMLVRRLIQRCQELKLVAPRDPVRLQFELAAYLATLVTNHLYTGRFKRSV